MSSTMGAGSETDGVRVSETEPTSNAADGGTIRFSTSKTILFVLIINLGFFAAVELTARVGAFLIYDRSPYFLFYGINSPVAPPDPVGNSVRLDGYSKFPPSRVLQQSGLFKEPTPVQINSAGLRGPDFTPVAPDSVFRIISLGGSSTFGFYDRDEYTYPALLQAMLNDSAAGSFEVINAGIPLAQSSNLLAMLRAELLAYGPEVITIYSGYNDATFVVDANAVQRISRWLHGHFASYVALKRVLEAVGGPRLHSRWARHVAGATPEYVRRQIQLHVELYETNLRAIIDLATNQGASVVLVRQPIGVIVGTDRVAPSATYAEKARQIRALYDRGERLTGSETTHLIHSELMSVLDELADEPGVTLVDFISVVDEHPEFLASYVHVTEKGNAELARLLFGAVRAIIAY